MDITEIKKELQKINQQKERKSAKKVDFDKIFWKPPVGKKVIRVVPYKDNPNNPFVKAYFYYGIGNKVMISPITFDEKDPIQNFTKKLRETNEKENWSLANKLSPKLRIFAPVIVRGEEDKGVRWWQFGKTVYTDFLSMADDEDIGDYTDIQEGRDFTIDTIGPELTGTQYNKSSIRPKTKTTPLSDNEDQINKWLDNQPEPLEGYTRFTFEEMKENLQKWLTPEEDDEEDVEESVKESEVKTHNPNPLEKKKDPQKEFNDLFD